MLGSRCIINAMEGLIRCRLPCRCVYPSGVVSSTGTVVTVSPVCLDQELPSSLPPPPPPPPRPFVETASPDLIRSTSQADITPPYPYYPTDYTDTTASFPYYYPTEYTDSYPYYPRGYTGDTDNYPYYPRDDTDNYYPTGDLDPTMFQFPPFPNGNSDSIASYSPYYPTGDLDPTMFQYPPFPDGNSDSIASYSPYYPTGDADATPGYPYVPVSYTDLNPYAPLPFPSPDGQAYTGTWSGFDSNFLTS